MEYWRKQISAQTQIVSNGGNEVYSIFLADKLTTNDSKNNSTDSEINAEVLQEFYRFITPPKKRVINSPPPAPNKHNRIRHEIITLASLDPLWPHYDDYTPPPLPSPSPNITQVRNNLIGDKRPTKLISNHLCDQFTHTKGLCKQFTQKPMSDRQ